MSIPHTLTLLFALVQGASQIADAQSPAPPAKKNQPAAAEFLTKAEREMLDLVNGERSKAGVEPLRANRQLTDAARGHAANMARQRILNHTLDGKTFDQRITATGYRYSSAGENIYAGPSAAAAMAFWMRSSGHQRNLLSPDYQEIGPGMTPGNTRQQYWTQVFATPAAAVPNAPAARPSK